VAPHQEAQQLLERLPQQKLTKTKKQQSEEIVELAHARPLQESNNDGRHSL